MLFVVHCLDGEGAAERRAALMGEHSARLRIVDPKPLVYGPLVDDDDAHGIGSLFVIDVPDRAAAEAWAEGDPFRTGGVWGEVRVHRFRQSANAPVQLPAGS